MKKQDVGSMPLSRIYPLLVQKAERKGRTRQEVDTVTCWLTGYDTAELEKQLERQVDYRTFFEEAPCIHPHAELIKGVVCGVRVEEIEDPFLCNVRRLDKLVAELAKGKVMEKILRVPKDPKK